MAEKTCSYSAPEVIGAFEKARDAHRHIQSSHDWVVITVGLANAQLSYGTHLCLAGHKSDHNAGIDKIHQEIELYKGIIQDVSEQKLENVVNNVQISLQILGKFTNNDNDKKRFLSHVIDIIYLILFHFLHNLPEFTGVNRHFLIEKMLCDSNIAEIMASDKNLVTAHILGILSSSGLSKTEWPEILREAIRQIEPAAAASPWQTTLAEVATPPTLQVAEPAVPNSAHHLTDRPAAPPGELPLGMEWPKEKYTEAHKKYGWDIICFLEKRWLHLIKAGVVTRKVLRTRDRSAEAAVSNYIRNGRQLPDHLHIPTKKESVDQELARGTVSLKDANRLARAARRRGLHTAAASPWQTTLAEVATPPSIQIAETAAPNSAHHLTDRPAAPPLPEKAPELYAERGVREELGRKENIVEFLARVWNPWIRQETPILTRSDLRRFDEKADAAVEQWINKHKAPLGLPAGLWLPTKKELNDRILGEISREQALAIKRQSSAAERHGDRSAEAKKIMRLASAALRRNTL